MKYGEEEMMQFLTRVAAGLPVWGWFLIGAIGILNEVVQRAKWTKAQSILQGIGAVLKKTPLYLIPAVKQAIDLIAPAAALLACLAIGGQVVSGCAHLPQVTQQEKDELTGMAKSFVTCMQQKGIDVVPEVAQLTWGVLSSGHSTDDIYAALLTLAKQFGHDAVACAADAWLHPVEPASDAQRAMLSVGGVEAARRFLSQSADNLVPAAISRPLVRYAANGSCFATTRGTRDPAEVSCEIDSAGHPLTAGDDVLDDEQYKVNLDGGTR